MKKNIKKSTSIFSAFLLACCYLLVGCEKTDDTYKNYINKAGTYNGNALQFLESQPGVYDSMLLVINRLTGLRDTIASQELTVFALTNRSFTIALNNINQARLDSIPALPPVSFATMDSTVLEQFFCRYLIRGKNLSESLVDFTDGRLYETVRSGYNMHMQYRQTNASGFLNGGPKAIVFSDPKNSVFTVNWVRTPTQTVDIRTSNAIVHLLTQGHDFGFGTDFVRNINRF
jgi:hypothetical protein